VTFSDERDGVNTLAYYYQTYMKSDKAFWKKCMRAMVLSSMSNFIANMPIGSVLAGQKVRITQTRASKKHAQLYRQWSTIPRMSLIS